MAKYSKEAQSKVGRALKEMKAGTLKSGSGQKVKSKKQAIAIGLSEAREEGAKVPVKSATPKKRATKKSAPRKKVARKAPVRKVAKRVVKKAAKKAVKKAVKKAAPKPRTVRKTM